MRSGNYYKVIPRTHFLWFLEKAQDVAHQGGFENERIYSKNAT